MPQKLYELLAQSQQPNRKRPLGEITKYTYYHQMSLKLKSESG
jgi:hypothetical protein